MGLAYASLNDHHRALECYKKAADLDPNNESYKNNLSIAEEKVAELDVSTKVEWTAMVTNRFEHSSLTRWERLVA